MLLILIAKRVGDKTEPCGTPLSWQILPDIVCLNLTEKLLFRKKQSIYLERFPLRPKLYKSLSIPNFQVMSKAFSRSTKIKTKCSLDAKVSLTSRSSLTRWSVVDLHFLLPHCTFLTQDLMST